MHKGRLSLRRSPGTRSSRMVFLAICAWPLLLPGAGFADTVTIKGELTTATDLNPNYRDRPSPVVLIIFQLAAAESFNKATFFELYDPAAAVLGGDLIASERQTLTPGMAMEIEKEFDEEARFIGFVAAFRDIDSAQWRSVIPLEQRGALRSFFNRSKLMIELQSLAVNAVIE